jgi:paraquat-inducible protein B
MKKANPATLGLFVVLGLMLGVVAVFLFSSRTLFHPMAEFILYFDGSLKGLNPGAPVKFRGVTIGKVEHIFIRHNQASNDFAMPVIIAVDKTVAQSKSDQNLQVGNPERLELLISQGFRARLDAESLVTGILYVSLDAVHNPPPPVFHQVAPEYQEIPTLPSGVQRFLENLEEVDLPGLSTKLNTLLARLDTRVRELDVAQINASITNLLTSANNLVTTPDLTNAITAAKSALQRAQALVDRIDSRVDPLVYSVTNTLADARKTLADLRGALQNVSRLIGPDTSFSSDLSQALEQLSNASRAVADLAEFLERNPDALVTGRKRPKD